MSKKPGKKVPATRPPPPPRRVYEVFLLKAVEKTLKALDSPIQKRISDAIDKLATEPRPPSAKALQGGERGLTRVPCGDWRIVYQIEDDRLVVTVLRIGDRKEVYR